MNFNFSMRMYPTTMQILVRTIVLILIIFPSILSTDNSLPPQQKITLHGAAFFSNHTLYLTHQITCPTSPTSSSMISEFGSAIYHRQIRFVDAENKQTASFSSHFSFSISTASPLCSLGDGLALVIASNSETFSMVNDRKLCPPKVNPGSQDSFIALEFDTNLDTSHKDINRNHVGIDVNSLVSCASVDAQSKGIDLGSGRDVNAWISYRHQEKKVRVWISYHPVRPPSPALEFSVDLSKYLKEFMFVGFLASNGQNGSATHKIDQWRFKTFGLRTLPSVSTDLYDEGSDDEEEDCRTCFEEPKTESQTYKDSSRRSSRNMSLRNMVLGLGGIIGLAFSLTLIVVVVVMSCCILKKRRASISSRTTLDGGGRSLGLARSMTRMNDNNSAANQQTSGAGPLSVSLFEVKSYTAGFSKHRIIGKGASATVYQGLLPNGKHVAVKRFDQLNKTHNKPFITEFTTVARTLRHRNLVQILSWCCESNELVLIYEYLPNGSLDQVLHGNSEPGRLLSWEKRMNIVLGVASALAYLHEECDRQIIHRDVKSSNILLDKDYNAKLCDFGLAEIYEHHSSRARSITTPAGTAGYLAPEYVYSGVPTIKSDVYSFGVVILEIVSGRKPVDDDLDDGTTLIVDWAWDLWEKRKLMKAAEWRIVERHNKFEIKRLLKVGLWCVHPNCEKRPTVREAIKVIREEDQLPVLPPKKPKMKFQSVTPIVSETTADTDSGHENIGAVQAMGDSPWLTPKSHF